jgi:hypothetical protein
MPSETSLKLYKRLVEKVRNGTASGTEGYTFLGNYSEVISWIEAQPLSINSKKAIYIALKTTLRDTQVVDNQAAVALRDAERAYEKRMLNYRDEHNKIAITQTLSPREENLWVEWPDIVAGLEKVHADISSIWEYQDYVIYSLYVLNPPLRLDYAPMKVVYSRDDLSGCSENCLVWDSNPCFYLQNYKTSSKYGKVFIYLSPALEDVIEEWLQLNPSGWLLMNYAGTEPMDEQGLANRIKYVCSLGTGKELGVSMLRHSYVTYQRRGEPAYIEQSKMCSAMLHSAAMSQMYRRL